LASRLSLENHQVRPLTRREWDVLQGPPPAEVFDNICGVVHLAGAPVARRWNEQVKRELRASRVDATNALVDTLRRRDKRPRVLVSASAVGYYGSRGDEILTESSAPGGDFLARIAVDWEQAATAATALGIRVVTLRTGIVLGSGGGALKQMLPPFRLGIGGHLGSGRQWMSWIHIQDLVSLILFALASNDFSGPLNGTAPNPVTAAEFAKTLGRVLHRPVLFPVPRAALKLLFGEAADVLLSSQRVLPEAAHSAGFEFQYANLEPALANCVGESQASR
jgi:uncharacterized protein (TIGR01777 family)